MSIAPFVILALVVIPFALAYGLARAGGYRFGLGLAIAAGLGGAGVLIHAFTAPGADGILEVSVVLFILTPVAVGLFGGAHRGRARRLQEGGRWKS